MGYYVRILSTSSECISLSAIRAALAAKRPDAIIEAEDGTDTDWKQCVLKHKDGSEIASLERNPVSDGSLGREELQEFGDEVKTCQPTNAAEWLLQYFEKVKCIYAFQLLSGTEQKNGWEILAAVKSVIWKFAPSIFQADAEGFSNEQGYHILWQFKDSVKGPWWMAIIHNGRWLFFQMELGNKAHREAFLKGVSPKGLKVEEGKPC
jgi:hypothetical protein